MLHKKQLEKQITNEVINDLFKIFINSESKTDFVLKAKKQNYKNLKTVWKIFFPKYDKYRQENLRKILKK